MKTFLSAVVLLSSLNLLGGENPFSDDKSEREKIKKSGIKSQTIVRYQYRFGEPQTTGIKQQRNLYDERGNLTETVIFDANQRMSEIISYEYTSDNRIGSIIYFSSDGDAMVMDTLTYDAKGRLIQETQYDLSGNILNTEFHRFNSETDKLKEIAYYGADGKLMWKTIFNYSKNGEVEKKTFDPDGTMTESENEKRIQSGREINTLRYDPNGNIISRLTSRYDMNDRKTEQLTYQPNGMVAVKELYGYQKPNMVEYTRKVVGNGQGVSKAVVRFKNGRVAEKSSLSLFGMESNSETFKYDKHGNLLEWTKYDSLNEPFEVVRYEYEYYRETK